MIRSVDKKFYPQQYNPILPQEIIHSLKLNTWSLCLDIRSVLNWYMTCKEFWEEYVNIDDDDEKIQTYIRNIRERNEYLMKKTFSVIYRNNILRTIDFENIRSVISEIKKEIASLVDQKFYIVDNPDPRTQIYKLKNWDSWKGMIFNTKNELTSHSVEILRAVFQSILIRYGWQILFRVSGPKIPIYKQIILFYPWNLTPIKTEYICFIGEGKPIF
jgi:hypothetical protein